MILPELSEHDVRLYLEVVQGAQPVADANGLVKIKCPYHSRPEHFIRLDVRTGYWSCLERCGRGDLFDFEIGRSKTQIRQAPSAVLRIIHDVRRKTEQTIPDLWDIFDPEIPLQPVWVLNDDEVAKNNSRRLR